MNKDLGKKGCGNKQYQDAHYWKRLYDEQFEWSQEVEEKLDEARRLAEEWRDYADVGGRLNGTGWGHPDDDYMEAPGVLPWEVDDE